MDSWIDWVAFTSELLKYFVAGVIGFVAANVAYICCEIDEIQAS